MNIYVYSKSVFFLVQVTLTLSTRLKHCTIVTFKAAYKLVSILWIIKRNIAQFCMHNRVISVQKRMTAINSYKWLNIFANGSVMCTSERVLQQYVLPLKISTIH